MTKARAREILRRVWGYSEPISASECAELEPCPGETMFQKCMTAAGVPGHDNVMRMDYGIRAAAILLLLAHADIPAAREDRT